MGIFSAPVQTGLEAHPVSYTIGTGSFPGVKRRGRGVDPPPPCSAELIERYPDIIFARQGNQGNSRHSDRNIGEHAPSYATVKNWVAQFKRSDFSTCVTPRPGRPKTVTIPEIIDQIHEIHELMLEDSRF